MKPTFRQRFSLGVLLVIMMSYQLMTRVLNIDLPMPKEWLMPLIIGVFTLLFAYIGLNLMKMHKKKKDNI